MEDSNSRSTKWMNLWLEIILIGRLILSEAFIGVYFLVRYVSSEAPI